MIPCDILTNATHPSLGLPFGALAGLLILAAFFCGSETGRS